MTPGTADAYNDYSSIVDSSIWNFSTPFIQLLDPKTCDGKTVLPGWGSTSSCGYRHYVLTNGYSGLYDGTAGSRTIYYDDTAWWTWGQKTVDLQTIAYGVYEANGNGGCDPGNADIVY